MEGLVPALLGYIDRAREKQYVLNAKSYYTAAQAELSSLYGEGKDAKLLDVDETGSRAAAVVETASVDGDVKEVIIYVVKDTVTGTGSKAVKSNHGYYTVKAVKYVENETTLWFDGSTWSETAPTVTAYTPLTIVKASN